MTTQKKSYSALRLSLLVVSSTLLSLFFIQAVLQSRVEAADGIHKQINFQGKLQNPNGTNVADTSYSVIFTLYDAASAGNNLWDETQSVSTTDGIFRVSLGSVDTTLGAVNFNTDGLYLGVKVGADAEMTPRIRFTAVPYALNAQKVNGLTVTNTSDLPFSSATTLKIGNGKTVSIANGLSFSGTDSTAFVFPSTGGNIVTEAFTQTLTNKTIGSTGLTFSGATSDIITPSGEHFAIMTGGTGNVGIGTTTPANKLSVWGTGTNGAGGALSFGDDSFVRVKELGTGDTDALELYGDAGVFVTDGYLAITAGDAAVDHVGRLVIENPVDVNSDAFMLKRPGALSATNISLSFSSRSNNTDFSYYGYDGTTYKNFIYFDYPDSLVSIGPDVNALAVNTSTGNVGIGTSTSTTFELEVAGNVGPSADSTYNLGSTGVRWANGYFDTLYGDGSNLTGVTAGSVALSAITAATGINTIANGNNAQTWNWGTLTTHRGLTLGGGTAMTTGGILSVNNGSTYVHTTAETGSLVQLGLSDASTNASGNSITNVLSLATTVNTSGAGTKAITGVNVASPTITACTSGACTWSGLNVNTLTSGPLATLTSNGLNIAATGVASGALNGINISGITAGAGTEYAINVGTTWDAVLRVGATTILSGAGVLQTGGLSGTYSSALTLSSTTNAFTATSLVLTRTAQTTQDLIALTGGTAVTTGSAFDLASATYVHTVLNEVGNVLNLTFADASTNANNGGTTNGLNIASTLNTTGAGTKTVNAINIAAPTLTACTTGACTWNGLKITGNSAVNVTGYGLYVDAGAGAGTEYAGVFMNGNVGIGMALPETKLDIDTESNTLGLRLRGIAETVEIADVYVGSGGELVLSTVAGTDTLGYIDMRSEDNEYGLVLRESDGTGTTTLANFYVTDAATDYLNIVVNNPTSTTGLVLDANGNVGIGTTSPGSLLDIYAAAPTLSFRHSSGTNQADNGVILFTETVTPAGIKLRYDGSTGTGGGTFHITDISSSVNTDLFSVMRNGNVGIGSTGPTALLDVAGTFILGNNGGVGSINTSDWDISTTGVMSGISGITTNGGYSQSGSSANGFSGEAQFSSNILGTGDNTYFAWDATSDRIGFTKKSGSTGKLTYGSAVSFAIAQSNATNIAAANTFIDRFVIDSSGNVGIGTAAPLGLLNVSGAATGKALTILNETGNQDIFTASASGVARFSLTRAGGIKLGTSEGSATNCLLSGGAAAAATWGSCGGGSSQWTTVNTTELYYNTGNIGIGTTDPAGPLDVYGTAPDINNGTAFDFSPLLSGTNNQNGLRVVSDVNVSGVVSKTFTGIAGTIGSNEAGADLAGSSLIGLRGYAYIGGAGSYGSVQGGNYTLDLDAAGTISNGYGLMINDAAKSAGNINQLYGLYVTGQTKGTNHSISAVIGQASGATNNINLLLGQSALPTGNWSLYNGSSYDNYFAGNVGIGTTGPATVLDVRNNSINSIGWGTTSAQYGQNTLLVGTAAIVRAMSGYQLRFGANGGAADMVIDTTGNVGIGTTVPLGKLNVSGAATGKALTILNETGNQDIFTASASGVARFSLTRAGGIKLGTSEGTNGNCLLSGGAGVAASWGSCGAGGSGGLLIINKEADETVTSLTTLQPDDELTFAVGASETWIVDYVVQGNVDAAPDAKFAVTAPSGSTCHISMADNQSFANTQDSIGCGVEMIVSGNGTGDLYYVKGLITTGGTSGNVTLEWTQNTTSVNAVTVSAGSYLSAYNLTSADLSAVTQSDWVRNNGVITPKGSSATDLLLGSSSTASAKFAFLNVTNGTPTASIAGNLTFNGIASVTDHKININDNGTLNFTVSPKGEDGAAAKSALFINSAGNVGIGSTAPGAQLVLSGAINALADVGSMGNYNQQFKYNTATNGVGTGMAFTVSNTDSNVGGAIIFKRTGAESQGELQFYTKASTTVGIDPVQRMVIENDGNIGIGTTDAGRLMHIYGNGADGSNGDSDLRITSNGTGTGAGIQLTPMEAGGEEWTIFATNDTAGVGGGALAFWNKTDNNYRMFIDGDGRMGVGANWDPKSLLHLSLSAAPTTTTLANSYLHIGDDETAASSYRLISLGYVETGVTNYPAYMGYLTTDTTNLEKGALVFGTRDVTTDTAPTERLRIATNGNVGIGTTNPGEKLDIDGAIEVREMTAPGCASGEYKIYADSTADKLKKCENGTVSDLDTTGGGATTKYLVTQHDIASTTGTEVTGISTTLTAGTYTFKYSLIVQSSSTTVGLGLGINYTGTATSFVARQDYLGTGTAASTGSIDDTNTGVIAEQIVEGSATRVESTTAPNMNVIGGFAAANVNNYIEIEGVMVVSDGGDIELWHNSESASTTRVMAGSSVIITPITAGADLAEIYGTKDTNMGPGDVVSLDSSIRSGVKKSSKPYEQSAVGIIATSPSLVMGTLDDPRAVPVLVAMAGRVPVKVSTESGAIQFGDLLTSSSVPGVAMKATKAGQIIGQAMTEFNGEGVGKVMAFVKTDYSNGSRIADLVPGIDTSSSQSLNTAGKQALAYFVSQKAEYENGNGIDLSEIMTDRVAAGLEVITPRVVTDQIETKDINVSGVLNAKNIKAEKIEGLDVLVGDLFAQYASRSGQTVLSATASALNTQFEELVDTQASLTPSIASQSGGMTVDELHVKGSGVIEGMLNVLDTLMTENVIVNGLSTFFGEVVFKDGVRFDIAPVFSSDTAGYAVVKKGQKTVKVIFDKEYSTTPVINATLVVNEEEENGAEALLNADYRYVIVERSEKGFIVVLQKTASEDVTFSWTALQVK